MKSHYRTKSLSRRAFISAAGAATVSLPLLEAFEPKLASAASGVPRFVGFFVPNGKHMPFWTPTAEGADFELPPTLEPLRALRSKLLVLTGLANEGARRRVGGDHARGTGAFLTCTNIRTSEEIGAGMAPNGISMDQVIANQVGTQSRVKSMQLGISNDGGDQGYPSEFIQNISYDQDGRFLPKTVRVDAAFDRVFAGFDPDATAADVARRALFKSSVLDFVAEQANELKPRISKTDNLKIDQYLTSVRELEQRIQNDPGLSGAGCTGGPNSGHPDSTPDQIRGMLDVIVLALQCDATRVVTYMMGNGGDGAINGFPWLEVPDHHHGIAHHMSQTQNFDKLKKVDLWEVEQLGYLLGKLDAISEGGRTLLDNCVVLYSSEISDGNRHNHDNLPVLVAGGAGGAFRPGRHINYGTRPIAELYLSIIQALGANASQFGPDGNGPLPDLA